MEICIKWKMCRTCTADSSDQLQPLFSDPNLAKQLEEYAGIVVKPDDGLPDKICMDCTKSLQSVHAFLTGCRRSDAHLRSVVRRTMSSGIGFPSNSMDQSALKSHLRTHRNEKNYECELCSKRFNAACNLTTHMRTHTGEKPFECSHCSRRFADRSTHRKHERMHTNERPYACNMCTKTFSLSTTLKAHFLSHSKEKPHKCVTCNKGFRLPHQLKAHERTHVHRYEVGIMLYNQDEGDYSSS
ncbi:hypothetical protein AWZ03_004016 [Drosophila navojoa]|uniref:Protein krueppel n=1 Tax=Drosophila navojoa TaxID=7232 RepID=A0A484BNS8_DRONA|nr:hypothetical protein AWZ03_004016 [Drosophila navojoa]